MSDAEGGGSGRQRPHDHTAADSSRGEGGKEAERRGSAPHNINRVPS